MIASYSVLGIVLYLFKESYCSVQIKRKNDRSPRYPFTTKMTSHLSVSGHKESAAIVLMSAR